MKNSQKIVRKIFQPNICKKCDIYWQKTCCWCLRKLKFGTQVNQFVLKNTAKLYGDALVYTAVFIDWLDWLNWLVYWIYKLIGLSFVVYLMRYLNTIQYIMVVDLVRYLTRMQYLILVDLMRYLTRLQYLIVVDLARYLTRMSFDKNDGDDWWSSSISFILFFATLCHLLPALCQPPFNGTLSRTIFLICIFREEIPKKFYSFFSPNSTDLYFCQHTKDMATML